MEAIKMIDINEKLKRLKEIMDRLGDSLDKDKDCQECSANSEEKTYEIMFSTFDKIRIKAKAFFYAGSEEIYILKNTVNGEDECVASFPARGVLGIYLLDNLVPHEE